MPRRAALVVRPCVANHCGGSCCTAPGCTTHDWHWLATRPKARAKALRSMWDADWRQALNSPSRVPPPPRRACVAQSLSGWCSQDPCCGLPAVASIAALQHEQSLGLHVALRARHLPPAPPQSQGPPQWISRTNQRAAAGDTRRSTPAAGTGFSPRRTAVRSLSTRSSRAQTAVIESSRVWKQQGRESGVAPARAPPSRACGRACFHLSDLVSITIRVDASHSRSRHTVGWSSIAYLTAHASRAQHPAPRLSRTAEETSSARGTTLTSPCSIPHLTPASQCPRRPGLAPALADDASPRSEALPRFAAVAAACWCSPSRRRRSLAQQVALKHRAMVMATAWRARLRRGSSLRCARWP